MLRKEDFPLSYLLRPDGKEPRAQRAAVEGLESTVGLIINLSETGACIRVREKAEEDDPINVDLTIDGEELVLNGRIIWCRKIVRRVFEVGVAFNDPTARDRLTIRNFLGTTDAAAPAPHAQATARDLTNLDSAADAA